MGEIRCPMCGKPNPDDLEVCQFCEARLKPLIIQPTPDESNQIHPEQNNSFQEIKSESDSEPSDWLSGLRDAEVTQEGEPQGDSQSQFDSDVPEWLSRIQSDVESDQEMEEEAREPFPPADWSPQEGLIEQGEIPDWLTDLRPEGEQPVESWEQEESGQQDSQIPEWLQRLRKREMEDAGQELDNQLLPEEDSESITPFSDEQALPQVSSGDPKIAGSQIEKETTSEESMEVEVDGSQHLIEEPEGTIQEVTGERESQPVDQGESETGWDDSKGREDIPEWLKELGAVEEEPLQPDESISTPDTPSGKVGNVFEEEQEQAPSFLEEGDLPDWLKETVAKEEDLLPELSSEDEFTGEEIKEAPTGEEGEIEPIADSDLPDWLGKEYSEEDRQVEPLQEPELSPVELPSWLEAMRPVEDAAPKPPTEPDIPDNLETAGPLAGLRGVLSASEEVGRVQSPPAYSGIIYVTDSQRLHAELLKNMVANEGKVQPITRPVVIAPQLVLRWIIALVLVLTVLWPIVMGSNEGMLPNPTSEILAVNQIINDLPSNSRVLLAFDYQPGLSGEMDSVASGIIDHLMSRGTYLTLVSTSTSGPMVGEHFLQKTQSTHEYTNGIQYINLGYIPGGSSGLLSFAENPGNTLPYTIDSQSAWESAGSQALPPLQGINGILDFSMVMVMTDNPDTARAWIEQVGPHLISDAKSIPLIMVASAQAKPLIQPYYESDPRQIQGLIGGMQDGAAYTQLTGMGVLPGKYWDAFSYGLIVAALILIAGGIFTTVVTTLQGDRRVEGQEKV